MAPDTTPKTKSKKSTKSKPGPKAKPKTKKKTGRRSVYSRFAAVAAESLASQGLRDEDMAKRLNVATSTFYLWQKKFPEFAKAIKRGKAIQDDQVEAALLKRAKGFSQTEETVLGTKEGPMAVSYEKTYAPNVTAAMYWLNNRRPEKWRHVQSIIHSAEGDQMFAMSKAFSDFVNVQNTDPKPS